MAVVRCARSWITDGLGYHVICRECGEPAAVYLSDVYGAQVRSLYCSNDGCVMSEEWFTEREWADENCQGHCGRWEFGVPGKDDFEGTTAGRTERLRREADRKRMRGW